MFPQLKLRHQRDLAHLQQLIKAVALLNVWFRRQPDGSVVASQSDVEQALQLWGSLAESQDMNVSPALVDFFKKYILAAYLDKANNPDFSYDICADRIGVTRQEVLDCHFRTERSMFNEERFRKEILPQLRAAGIIEERKPDAEGSDKRSPHIFPKWFPQVQDPRKSNNIGNGGGDIPPEVMEIFFGPKQPEEDE